MDRFCSRSARAGPSLGSATGAKEPWSLRLDYDFEAPDNYAMPRGKKARSSLKTYVALLRGINLGARNKVPMQDLRALFADLGAEDVATYVQSGNVVFRSADSLGRLTDAIEKRIRRDLGLDVTVLVRTQRQLAKLVAANPFAHDVSDPTKLHVTFLADKPDQARVRKLDPTLAEPDEFSVIGQEVYLHCPNGYGRSKLSNAYFEKQLDVIATTRNWRTVTKLAEARRRLTHLGDRHADLFD